MQVTIWGARGSIPTPIRPEEIKEKIITAMLGVSQVQDNDLREALAATILGLPQPTSPQPEPRTLIETYLEGLSPLADGTASGNTACIEIQTDHHLFIIDAGSGIRELGLELMKGDCGQGNGVIHLLFSHPHWDHIQGFPFFRPAFVPGNQIHIYSVHDMESVLRRQQEFINFPVPLDYMAADFHFHGIEPEQVLEFGELRIRNLRNNHPGDAYSYRFEHGNKVFVYASDAAFVHGADVQPHVNFFANADVLIFDTQFTQRESDEKEDWGHSSSFVGVELAHLANAKTLLLYHYDPTYSDKDLEKILTDTLKFQANQYPNAIPLDIIIAREAQTFDLTPPKTTALQQMSGGDVAVLTASGIFNEHVAAELQEQVNGLEETEFPSQLVIDISQVEMLQVAGLRALVKLRKTYTGSSIVLVGPSINVQQLIELAGYQDFFATYPTVKHALGVLQARKQANLPGQTLKNRYQLETELGDGRIGVVYQARDTKQSKTVVIKIISASFAQGATEQFLEQARQLAQLNHPNILNILDCDTERELSFIVEEFIERDSLRHLIENYGDQPLPLDLALGIAERVTQALEYAHTHNVIHGDLKPKNIMLNGGSLKVADFGLGQLESGKPLLNIDIPPAFVTAHYLAPEQVLGQTLEARTDIYALGVTLYQLFTGQLPFTGSDKAVMEQHLSSSPKPLRELNPNLSPILDHVVLKMLEKDVNKRYDSVRQIRQILSSILTTTQGAGIYNRFAYQREQRFSLIHRDKPMNRLRQAWKSTQQGQGAFVFITGKDGFGKTRLVREFARQTQEAILLLGEFTLEKQLLPYQPFIEAIDRYLTQATHDQTDHQIVDFFEWLKQVVRGADSLLNTHETISGIEITTLTDAIKQVTAVRPCLLLLDDLHWADASSLHLLDYFGRICQDSSLMIVATYSHDYLKRGSLVEGLLSHHAVDNTVALTRFSGPAIKQFLTEYWQQTVPDKVVQLMARCTQGNPLYLERLAQILVEEQVVRWVDGQWAFDHVSEEHLPKNATEIIPRLLGRLSKEIHTLLSQAAVLGHRFEFAELHEISYLPEMNVLDCLDIALERGLIEAHPVRSHLQFRHPHLQQVLYNSRSPLERRRMHYEAGETLEQLYESRLSDLAPLLTFHYSEAGDPAKVVNYSQQAARHAEARQASEQALKWYTLGLNTLSEVEPTHHGSAKFELLLARERIHKHIGRLEEQAEELAALEILLNNLEQPDLCKQAMLHHRQAAYERIKGQYELSLKYAQQSLAEAQQANDPILRAESLLQLGYIALTQGWYDMAHKELDTALTILTQADAPEGQARALNGLGIVCQNNREYEQAEAHYRQALIVNQTHHQWNNQAATLNCLGSLYLLVGDLDKAEIYSQRSLEINRIIGHQRGVALCKETLAKIRAVKNGQA